MFCACFKRSSGSLVCPAEKSHVGFGFNQISNVVFGFKTISHVVFDFKAIPRASLRLTFLGLLLAISVAREGLKILKISVLG